MITSNNKFRYQNYRTYFHISLPVLISLYHSFIFRKIQSHATVLFFQTYQNLELHMSPKLKMKQGSWESCNLCNFTVRNTFNNSQRNDVIIANAIDTTQNVVVFIRTLRTTGSQAHCVFMMD